MASKASWQAVHPYDWRVADANRKLDPRRLTQ